MAYRVEPTSGGLNRGETKFEAAASNGTGGRPCQAVTDRTRVFHRQNRAICCSTGPSRAFLSASLHSSDGLLDLNPRIVGRRIRSDQPGGPQRCHPWFCTRWDRVLGCRTSTFLATGDLTAQDWRWFQPLPVSRERSMNELAAEVSSKIQASPTKAGSWPSNTGSWPFNNWSAMLERLNQTAEATD